MQDTAPVLTEAEAAELARIIDALGVDEASRAFALDRCTVLRAAARLPLRRGSAVLVRRGIALHASAPAAGACS
jgi:hypothetical protein